MQKSNFYTGISYLIVGLVCLDSSLNIETKIGGILFGFAMTGIVFGSVILFKYYYYSRPKNQNIYIKKLEQENIELNDERKTILRDKSGRYAYNIGLIVISASVVLFSILNSFNDIEGYNLIIIYLAGYLIFQYIIGVLIFNYLNKNH